MVCGSATGSGWVLWGVRAPLVWLEVRNILSSPPQNATCRGIAPKIPTENPKPAGWGCCCWQGDAAGDRDALGMLTGCSRMLVGCSWDILAWSRDAPGMLAGCSWDILAWSWDAPGMLPVETAGCSSRNFLKCRENGSVPPVQTLPALYRAKETGAGRNLTGKFGFFIEILKISSFTPACAEVDTGSELAPGWEKHRWEGKTTAVSRGDAFARRRWDARRF